MFTLLLAFSLIIALYLFIHKVVMKGKMQKQLGRKVEDRELTSISAWMEEPDAKQKK